MKHTIFKTISIGGKKKYTFDKDIYISDYAKDLQSKTPLAKKKEDIDLVILTPKDLGFTDYSTTTQLFDEKNLAKYGVELCPAEVGLALREQYTDQPAGEWLYIAMEPITDSDGYPRVFCVERDSGGGRWLRGGWVFSDGRWILDYRVVFRLRKSTLDSGTQTSELNSDSLPSDSSAELSSEARLESAIKMCKEAGYKIIKEM